MHSSPSSVVNDAPASPLFMMVVLCVIAIAVWRSTRRLRTALYPCATT